MATIQDVAKKAGVSVATVSHVVNRTRYVSPTTVKKVEEVIESLDEIPKFILKKRGESVKGTKKFILVFAADIFNSFQSSIIQELKHSLEDEINISLVMVQTDDANETIQNYVLSDTKNCIGKVIINDRKLNTPIKFHTSIKTLPTIIISENSLELKQEEMNAMHVLISDRYNGAYNSVKHLINHGHERIALLHENMSDYINANSDDLIKGYEDALLDKSIAVKQKYVVKSNKNSKEKAKRITRLFSDVDPPTALIITNENALLSTLKFMNTHNLRCPEDLSIIGFNDLDWYGLFTPAITAVAQNTKMISDKVIEILTEQEKVLAAPKKNSGFISVPTIMNIRASTSGIARGPFGEKAASVESIELSESDVENIKQNKYSAVISFHYSGAAWMNLHEKGIREVFNELGISILAVTDAHFDPEMQNKQLEGLLALNPDIFIAIPTEDNKTSAVFKKIAQSAANLVLITNVPNGLEPEDYVSCVSVNEWSHGRLAASGLGTSMREENKKNVGLMLYDSNFYATNQRDTAAIQILSEEFSDLNILETSYFVNEQDVYEQTFKLIKSHPEIEGIYVSWEGPAAKVLQALDDLDRNDVLVGTADLDYSLGLKMAKGDNVKRVSAQLPYEQGKAIALVAANAILLKKVPKFIGVEPIEVSSENLRKMWKRIFKENAPDKIVEALKDNTSLIQ